MLECRFFHFHFPAILNSIDDIKYSKQHNTTLLEMEVSFYFSKDLQLLLCEWMTWCQFYLYPSKWWWWWWRSYEIWREGGIQPRVLYWLQLPFTQPQTFLRIIPIVFIIYCYQHLHLQTDRFISAVNNDLTDRGDVIMRLVLMNTMFLKLQYSFWC